MDLRPALSRVWAFELEAHSILGRHEASPSRVVLLDNAYRQIDGLSVAQDDLFRQALRCTEHGLFRAAHVMAFAGFMDLIFERLGSDDLVAVRRERPFWRGSDIFEMAEHYPDKQFIEVCRSVGLATKNDVKQMVSLLDRRNECAHPSAYYPNLNMTLGYIGEVLHRAQHLKDRVAV
jgi:hypothetical protein